MYGTGSWTRTRSPISVLTGPDVDQLCWSMPARLTTTPGRHPSWRSWNESIRRVQTFSKANLVRIRDPNLSDFQNLTETSLLNYICAVCIYRLLQSVLNSKVVNCRTICLLIYLYFRHIFRSSVNIKTILFEIQTFNAKKLFFWFL